MEKEAILRLLQEDIHSTIAATLGEDGHPQTRAIDIMLIEDGKSVFLTARGKAFYDQLRTQKFIALSGVKEEISVSLRGQVRLADPGLLDLAFERNPYMQTIYPGTTRQALVMFELYEGQGEIFDLNQRPVYRQRFTIGEVEPTGLRYGITAKCDDCGVCLSVCPQQCIELTGKQARICQEHCLHCGQCQQHCPRQAVVREP